MMHDTEREVRASAAYAIGWIASILSHVEDCKMSRDEAIAALSEIRATIEQWEQDRAEWLAARDYSNA